MGRERRLLDKEWPARAGELAAVRAAVRQAAREAGCPSDALDAIVLAAGEACANVVRHAYGEGEAGAMRVTLDVEEDEGQDRDPRSGAGSVSSPSSRVVVLRVLDFGPPVPPGAVRARPPGSVDELRPGGLGLYFIRELMDDVRFERLEGGGRGSRRGGGGNVLEMRKCVGPPAPERASRAAGGGA